MKKLIIKIFVMLLLIGGGIFLGQQLMLRLEEQGKPRERDKGSRAAPVEVLEIKRGPITLRRIFSGTLEARADFIVSPKVGGRIESLAVDLADTVIRGQVVAKLDNDEYLQAVTQGKANIAVAKANLIEAKNALEISNRGFERFKSLRQRSVASDFQFDEAMVNKLTAEAQLEVAKAQLTRAESLLEIANIRLTYSTVTVDWKSSDEQRIVAARYVDEGHTVAANASLLRIVAIDPIIGVMFITEKDYARLQKGQVASLSTDAYPGQAFSGKVARISPVFNRASRQVRVELTVANPQHLLKPGMFIRAIIEFETVPDATVIPEQALTKRADQVGVFIVDEATQTVMWRPVKIGIREGDQVQVSGEKLRGRVVTLGHQMVDEGSAIIIPENGNQQPVDGGK